MLIADDIIPSPKEMLDQIVIGTHKNMVQCLKHDIEVNYLVPESSYVIKLRKRMLELYQIDFGIYSRGAVNLTSNRNWYLIFKNYTQFTAGNLIGFRGAVLCHPDVVSMSSFKSDYGVLSRICTTNERHKQWLS